MYCTTVCSDKLHYSVQYCTELPFTVMSIYEYCILFPTAINAAMIASCVSCLIIYWQLQWSVRVMHGTTVCGDMHYCVL